MAHRRGKFGFRPMGSATGAASGAGVLPSGGSALGGAIARNLQFSMLAGSGFNASTAHGTNRNLHRSGSIESPQTFVRMTTQGGANTLENIQPTAAPIRIARRALSRTRGRPGA